jgi:hypothetical protein
LEINVTALELKLAHMRWREDVANGNVMDEATFNALPLEEKARLDTETLLKYLAKVNCN